MVSGCFALLHIFFPSFDLYLLTLDVETKAVVDAHVLIRNPHQGKQRDQISSPIFIEQLITRDYQKQDRYVVAEAVFAGKQVEKLTPEKIAPGLALTLARVSRERFLHGLWSRQSMQLVWPAQTAKRVAGL